MEVSSRHTADRESDSNGAPDHRRQYEAKATAVAKGEQSHAARVTGVQIGEGEVVLTVSPVEATPARFAADLMGWNLVRVAADAEPAAEPRRVLDAAEHAVREGVPPAKIAESGSLGVSASVRQLDLEHAAKALRTAGRDVRAAIALCRRNAASPGALVPPDHRPAYAERQTRIAEMLESGRWTVCSNSPDCANPAVAPNTECGNCGKQLVAVRESRMRRQYAQRQPPEPHPPPPALHPYWRKTVDALAIELTWDGTWEELRQAAYEMNCQLRAKRNEATHPLDDVKEVVLSRWMVSHVRHNHSNYPRVVNRLPENVKPVVRDKFNAAIAERYDLLWEPDGRDGGLSENGDGAGEVALLGEEAPQAGAGAPAADVVSRVREVDAEEIMSLPKAEAVRGVVVAQQGRLKSNWSRPFVREHAEGGASVVLTTTRGERYYVAAE